jgi:hypothetical protein
VIRIRTEAAAPAEIVNRIAASALAGWIAGEKSFFSVHAYSHRYDTLVLPDLLMHYLLNAAAGSDLAAKHFVDRQIEALSSSRIRRRLLSPRPQGS